MKYSGGFFVPGFISTLRFGILVLYTGNEDGEMVTKYNVCDDCLNIAYDNGFSGYDSQANAMVMLGGEVEDHECIKYLEPGEKCDCGC